MNQNNFVKPVTKRFSSRLQTVKCPHEMFKSDMIGLEVGPTHRNTSTVKRS